MAVLLAHRLGLKLVIAKNNREVGVSEFIQEVYIPNKSAIVISLYVPRDALKKSDCVLIVDDVIDSGETQMALAGIVQRAKGELTGVFALVGLNTNSKTKMEQTLHCPVEVVYQMDERPLHTVSDVGRQFR